MGSGYDQIKKFILGEKYTPGWAEGITDIPAREIEALAEEYAAPKGRRSSPVAAWPSIPTPSRPSGLS